MEVRTSEGSLASFNSFSESAGSVNVILTQADAARHHLSAQLKLADTPFILNEISEECGFSVTSKARRHRLVDKSGRFAAICNANCVAAATYFYLIPLEQSKIKAARFAQHTPISSPEMLMLDNPKDLCLIPFP